MADRLMAHCDLKGMAKSEVIAMLGVPPTTGYFRDYDLVYYLGPERGWMGIDSEWLVLKLDGSGKVTQYRMPRD